MADSGGGNGFPFGKSPSLKNPSSAKDGKDADSGKSKKGRKVQFGDDVNDWSKGGKGGKGGKGDAGGKSPVQKEVDKRELNVEQELPNNAECMMDCEAADILQGIQEQMIILSRDPTIKLPPSFDPGLQYAKSTAQYSNVEAVRQTLNGLKKYGVADGEICVIANTCPETIDELLALVPTLKAKGNKLIEALQDVLTKLEGLRIKTDEFKY